MNDCTRIQSLLPGFVESELGEADASAVRSHVAVCEACRTALASFDALESALTMRRDEVPPPDAYFPQFASAHPGLRTPLIRVFRTLTSVPGVSILLAMWAAMLAFNFRVPIAGALSHSTPERLAGAIDRFANFLVLLAGGNAWFLIGIATLIGIAIVLSTGAVSLRFVRR